MNIIELLTDIGIEEDAAKKAERAINKALPMEFIPKDQYNKKVLELDDTKKALKEAGSATSDRDAYKTKYDESMTQYEAMKAQHAADIAAKDKSFADYKAEVEAKETTAQKRAKARKWLLDHKMESDVADDFALDKLDYDAMTLDGDAIKDADAYFRPYQERYAKYFGTTTTEGVPVPTPPPGSATTYSMDDIKKMSPDQINKNWGKVKDTLQKGN